MANRKMLGRLTAFMSVLALAFAGSASAAVYILPGPPGSPGGPPTKPVSPPGSHGNKRTENGALAVGYRLAGHTAAELVNIQTFTLTVFFPRAGTVYARIGAAGIGELGAGFAGRANRGTKPMSISLSAKGRQYLNAVNTQPVRLTIKFAFQPNTGRTQFSTTTVTTAP